MAAARAAPGRAGGAVLRRPFGDAAALIREPEARRQGWRLLWLGNSGTGKTVGIRALLAEPWPGGLTLIHDDKERDPQYPGAAASSIDAAPDDAEIVTLRGNVFAGESFVEVDTVAELALQVAMSGVPVRLVVDELDRAVTPGGKVLQGKFLRDCLTKGRSLDLSVLATTQAPQRCPVEVIDQATIVALGQLGPRALNYLDERMLFDAELLSVVETLQPLEFVLYQQGRHWNRCVYTTPLPAKKAAPAEAAPAPTPSLSTISG